MADYKVMTAFMAADRVSRALGKMSKGAGTFGDRASRAFNRASRSGSRFGDILKGVIGANIITAGFRQLSRGLMNVGREFVSLDDAIVSASAKFADINLLEEEGRQQMVKLQHAAREVGAATQFTATQAGQGLDYLALAGFNSVQAMAMLPQTVNLATVAQIDLARATDIASDALGAFDLVTSDAVQQEANFSRLNDVMALTMARTNTGIEDMFEAMKKGAPIFTQAGQSVETFNAMIGVMAGAGVKGAEAGTQLRNMMLRLTNVTPKAQGYLDRFGITVGDSEGNIRDALDILNDFEKALKGVGSEERLKVLGEVFGVRSVTGQAIMIAKGTDALVDFRQQLIDSGGAADRMATIIRSSLGNRLKALQSAALETGFKIFDAFKVRGTNALDRFTETVRNVDLTQVIAFLDTMWVSIKNMADAFGPLVKAILPVAVTVFSALTSVLKTLSPILPLVAGGWIAYKVATIAATVAQTALNIAMTANPIGLIIVGIGALIAAGVLLYQNWDTIKWKLLGAWQVIKQEFKKVVIWIVDKLAWMARAALRTAGAVASLFGLDTSGIEDMLHGIDRIQGKMHGIEPPNKTEIESKQKMTFEGQLNIAGAPTGSTLRSRSTGGASVNVAFVGMNP